MSDEFRVVPRKSTEAERRSLKEATENALDLARAVAFEPFTRVKAAALSKYGSKSEPANFLPIDVALELDRYNGAPIVLATLAGMLGYRLTPAAEVLETELSIADAQAIAKESGDVVNLLLALLTAGKKLGASDRHEILRELSEAKASLYRLAAKVGGAS